MFKIVEGIDPKVAQEWEYEKSIPFKYLKSNQDKFGDLIHASLHNPVRHIDRPYLYFFNSKLFTPAANDYRKSIEEVKGTNFEPAYTNAIKGTKAYKDYWYEQRKRCLEGYTVGGVWITGEHYFYLNFCRIKVTNPNGGEKLDFPSFNTMDYYDFLELYDCESNPDETQRRNRLITKARRKGYSYKNAAGCTHKFLFFRESTVVIAAQSGRKARITFDMCLDMIDFINEHTEFKTPTCKRKSSDTGCRIMAGVEATKRGIKYIKGSKSQIIAVSLKDRPDAAAGFGASRIIIDEAGYVIKLLETFAVTEPVLRDGAKRKGIMIIFGTGGDMESGATEAFMTMHYDPESYNCKSYDNIYDSEHPQGKCGWFVADMWFYPGFEIEIEGKTYKSIDENGNTWFWVAEIGLNLEREKRKKGNKKGYVKYLTQHCKTPAEAFMVVDGSVFPIEDLYERLNVLRRATSKTKPYTPGILVESEGQVQFKPAALLDHEVIPVTDFPLKSNQSNIEGCIMQYYPPEKINGAIPEDAYIIGFDHYRISGELSAVRPNSSLASIYVMRTRKHFDKIPNANKIVCTYVGRLETTDQVNEIALRLSKYYNCKVNFENEVGEIRPYFQKRKELNRLCSAPGMILEKNNISPSMRSRKFGYSMSNARFKEIAIGYVIDWLLETRVEDGNLRNLDVLQDEPLIQEMIQFKFNDKDGNYDRLMSFIGCILWQEDSINKYMEEQVDNKMWDFIINNPNLFNRKKRKKAFEEKVEQFSYSSGVQRYI